MLLHEFYKDDVEEMLPDLHNHKIHYLEFIEKHTVILEYFNIKE
jgi:hypothetical protein